MNVYENIEGPIRKGTQAIQLTRSDRPHDVILHTTQGQGEMKRD